MTNLNNINSPISREERNKLNENWQLLTQRFSHFQRHLNLLAGEDVEGVITNINERIAETDAALQQIETDLVEVNGAADNANTKAELAQTAADIAEQIAAIAQEKIDFIEEREEDIEFFTSMQNNLQAQVDQLVISGDSSPEAAQARIGTDGTQHNTLKARLDSEIGQVTTQLAQSNEKLRDVELVNVKYFGAKGDGITDDSEAIKLAIQHVPKVNGKLYFPEGIYIHGDGLVGVNGTGNSYVGQPDYPKRPLIDSTHPVDIGRDIRFQFIEYDNLTILGYGAIVKAHANNGECHNNEIFYFENCSDLSIKGLIIDGSSHNRVPKFSDYNTGNGAADRGNLRIRGGKNIKLENVTSKYSMMDGIQIMGYNGVHVDGVTITNCNADYSYRNGLTVSTAKSVYVKGGTYTNTGVTYGTAPMAGIDIEADWKGTTNDGVIVDGIYTKGNTMNGVIFSVGSRDCKIINSVFDGEKEYVGIGFDPTRWGYNLIENCHFINSGISTETRGVRIVKNTFDLIPNIPEGEYPANTFYSFFHLQGNDGDKDAYVIMDGNIFNVDLTNVSESANNIIVGQLWYEGRDNVEFTNNVIINMYTKGSPGYAFRPTSTRNSRTFGNKFIFNEDRLVESVSNYVFAPTEGRMLTNTLGNFKNNVVVGYPTSVKLNGLYDSRFNSLNTGQVYHYSQTLDYNAVYEVDATLLGSNNAALRYDVDLEFFSADKKVILKSNLKNNTTVHAFDSMSPTIDVPTNLSIYQNGKKIYIKTTGYYIASSIKVTVYHGNSYYFLDGSVNVFKKVSDANISGLSVLPYTANLTSTTSLSNLNSFLKPIGYNVYVTELNKTVWWNGVAWVDSSGATVQ